ncbi:MAG: HD-GYP domain-containing protein [Saccharofermentanales bacterium]
MTKKATSYLLILLLIGYIPGIVSSETINIQDIYTEHYSILLIISSLIILLLAALTIVQYFAIKARKKLGEVSSQLNSLFSNMQEGFAIHEIICDDSGKPVDYRFLDINESFENLTGLSNADVRNRTVKEILPGTEDYWIEKYGEVALTGKQMYFSNYSSELGKHFHVSVYSPAKNQFVTIFTDITDQVLAREKNESERKLLETILEDVLSGYWDWDFAGGTEYLSPGFKRMFGYEDDEMDSSVAAWQTLVFEEDLKGFLELLDQHVKSHGAVPFYNEIRYRHKDGSTVWVISSGRVVEWGSDGSALRLVGCNINITPIKLLEKELSKEKTLLKTTLHSLGDGVISTVKDGFVQVMNDVAEKLTGWTMEDAKGKAFTTVFNIINEFSDAPCENLVNKVMETGEIAQLANHTLLIRKNGEKMPIEDSVAPIRDDNGNISGAVLVFRDFTEKKEKQELILYLSYHDQLTGLYNRRFFEEELRILDTTLNIPFTIAMLDVNGLKLTNDAFGHLEGDELLKRIAKIMTAECRQGDIIARIGGDEFAVLFPNTNHEEADSIISRIYVTVSEEQMNNIVMSVSVGLETKVHVDQDIREVFVKAEEHMYRKKLTESQSMRNKTIQVILKTLNEKNQREKFHSEEVSRLSRRIGEVMGLGYETLKEIEIAALMHDIGKISVNETILSKNGFLTELEIHEVRKHPESGYQILKAVDEYSSLAEYALSHHERIDGNGYPRGLKGEEIPLISKIISVADAYDAMTAERPYRKAVSAAEALTELSAHAGTQFDENIVQVFVEHFDKIIS